MKYYFYNNNINELFIKKIELKLLNLNNKQNIHN